MVMFVFVVNNRLPAAPARELNCGVATVLAESPYLRLGLRWEYPSSSLVMDCRHGALGRVDHLMRKAPSRKRDLRFELVAEWTKI
jgi:hypothetical protein